MYCKFNHPDLAHKLFVTMPERDTVSYSSLINYYTRSVCLFKASQMIHEMYSLRFVPKPEMIAGVLSLCARNQESRLGRALHGLVVLDERIPQSVFLSTALVDMYFKSHDSSTALRVFYHMEVKNEVSWTAVIAGCTADRRYSMAIDCFLAMQSEGLTPNRVTLLTLLPACAESSCCKRGKEIHGYVFRRGLFSDQHLSAALISMYCRVGKTLRPARLVFERSETKDVVVWSSMIGSYAARGHCNEAMTLFNQMRVKGIQPNSVTLLALISLCTTLSSTNHGCGVHNYILKSGLNFNTFIGNALIDMYSKCGCLVASNKIFEEMSVQDPVSWSSLISAYGLHGYGKRALGIFYSMQDRKIEVDAITLLAVLSACNYSSLLEEGQMIFNHALKDQRMQVNVDHYACYIDLLGKSGKIEEACDVLRKLPMKTTGKIWSSLVWACKAHGRLDLAKTLANELIKSEPDNAANYTLLSMIHADSDNWLAVEEVRNVMRIQGLNKCYSFSRIELPRESL